MGVCGGGGGWCVYNKATWTLGLLDVCGALLSVTNDVITQPVLASS